MNKKESLYELINEKKTITCKEALEKGYARIYLSMLEKDNLI